MPNADFVDLVKTLRALGAVRVRAGALEVAFSAPEAQRVDPQESSPPVSDADARELAIVRRYAEEIP